MHLFTILKKYFSNFCSFALHTKRLLALIMLICKCFGCSGRCTNGKIYKYIKIFYHDTSHILYVLPAQKLQRMPRGLRLQVVGRGESDLQLQWSLIGKLSEWRWTFPSHQQLSYWVMVWNVLCTSEVLLVRYTCVNKTIYNVAFYNFVLSVNHKRCVLQATIYHSVPRMLLPHSQKR